MRREEKTIEGSCFGAERGTVSKAAGSEAGGCAGGVAAFLCGDWREEWRITRDFQGQELEVESSGWEMGRTLVVAMERVDLFREGGC